MERYSKGTRASPRLDPARKNVTTHQVADTGASISHRKGMLTKAQQLESACILIAIQGPHWWKMKGGLLVAQDVNRFILINLPAIWNGFGNIPTLGDHILFLSHLSCLSGNSFNSFLSTSLKFGRCPCFALPRLGRANFHQNLSLRSNWNNTDMEMKK